MNEVLLSSLIDKVNEQQIKIEEIKAKSEELPAYIEALDRMNTALEGLQSDVQKISFPQKEMLELSERLVKGIELLKRPVEKKIIHQHHHQVTKVSWIAAALFLVLCLLCTQLYSTYNKLEIYKANDTKYRYLKLEADAELNKLLSFTDSLFRKQTGMRDAVIAKEEQNQRDFEIMKQALQMENEAKELKKKVSKKAK